MNAATPRLFRPGDGALPPALTGAEALAPRTEQVSFSLFGVRHRQLHLRRPDRRDHGQPARLDIRQGDSRFVGFDARGSFRLGGRVWATLGIGYVDATLTTTNEPLPRIPPLRGTLSLDIPFGGLTISPELLFAGRQDRIFRGETETRGYEVVNVDASYVWPRQHVVHVLSFTGYARSGGR